MKRLWHYIPPYLSDVMGFEAVMNESTGLGIIDDCSRYRRLSVGRIKSSAGFAWPEADEEQWLWEMEAEIKNLKTEERPLEKGVRAAASNIRTGDIVRGTSKKVRSAALFRAAQMKPDFMMLSHAPSSSMISSEIETDAEYLSGELGIPVGCVPVNGDKDYLYGISRTLEAMGKLLIEDSEKVPKSINILGCNIVDWAKDTLDDTKKIMASEGLDIVSIWGMKEELSNLRKASAASVNWVVNVSGLRLAVYMKEKWQIPYICGAPFGVKHGERVITAVESAMELVDSGAEKNEDFWEKIASYQKDADGVPNSPENSTVLVVGEQLLAASLRQILFTRGVKSVTCASFGEIDKRLFHDGDVKLTCEEDLRKLAQEGNFHLIIADPDMKMAADVDTHWVPLPNEGNFSPVNIVNNENMFGEKLDSWLNNQMAKSGLRPRSVRFSIH